MSSSSSVWSIVGLGLGFGVVHVLTGPDHLSALATLAANVDHKAKAFVTGVQWGIGHSIGLVVVATALLLALPPVEDEDDQDDEIDVSERLSTILESCVGVFMILLGLYGIYEAIRKTKPPPSDASGDETKPATVEMTTPSITLHDHHGHDHHHHHFVQMGDDDGKTPDENTENGAPKASGTVRAFVRTLVTIGIGIVHGVAGPGGVLGVLPAVQLREKRLAAVYLGCFCLASTLTMGVFAAVWGSCSSRIATKISPLAVELASAGLSIAVGILWLVLLSLGILEDVFP